MKSVKKQLVIAPQKGASIRGAGGHRMTGDRCTALQSQAKKVVKEVTAEEIMLQEKVCNA